MTGGGGRRRALLAREAGRLSGNRIWRVETPRGPAVQKYYAEKGGLLRNLWRGAWSGILRGATGSRAAERWRVEGEMLALWREAGVDVPRDLTAEFPGLAGERVRILEWIGGRPLTEALAGGAAGAEREALLRRAGAAWGGRLGEAVRRGDARLVQFHAGFMHLLVAGERMVAIDLEQAYLPGRAVLPRAAREVASCLRSLAKGREGEALRGDLRALAEGFPDRALLADLVARAARPGGILGAAAALGRNRGRVSGVLAAMAGVLRGE